MNDKTYWMSIVIVICMTIGFIAYCITDYNKHMASQGYIQVPYQGSQGYYWVKP
jgi:hypothetical protein